MEPSTEELALLDKFPQPVFLVKDRIITHVNHEARQRQLEVNTPVTQLISIGAPEYAEFSEGKLLLNLTVGSTVYNTSVTQFGDYHLFYLESEFKDPELRVLALSAQNLREPLSSAMVNMEQLLPSEGIQKNPSLLERVRQLNRNLYQLHRVIANMSDAGVFNAQYGAKFESRDAVSFINEIVSKASALVEKAGHHIQLETLNKPVYCMIHAEKLERAVLNMISNAIKHSPADSVIRVSIKLSGQKLYLSVQNGGTGVDKRIQANIFSRFLREPSLDDYSNGIGLGLTFVRGVATAHKGTVLIHQPEGEGLIFMMSISLDYTGNGTLNSPILLPIDYSGGYDRMLIELSDILPAEVFE